MKKKTMLLMAFIVVLMQAGCSQESKVDSNEQIETSSVIEIEGPDEALVSDVQDMAVSDTVLAEQPVENKGTDSKETAEDNVTAYFEDGTEEILKKDSDDTFLTEEGARYYLGDDGVYRARGYDDLYVNKPQITENKDQIDFISKHGFLKSRETEASELNNTMWCSFESYNKIDHEYGDYRSETSGEFKNANIKFGEMGEGVLYLDDKEIEFTYVLAEYPTKAEGKTKTGEDILMEFHTFNFDGSDIEIIKMEVGEWSIDFWPLG